VEQRDRLAFGYGGLEQVGQTGCAMLATPGEVRHDINGALEVIRHDGEVRVRKQL
jgi:hypothetical protein